jgi:hypothetical protein
MRLNTRHWAATRISKDYTGAGGKVLLVTGEVETLTSNQALKLTEAVPQGINPRILLLKLSVTTSGIGSDIVVWKQVEFTATKAADTYTHVSIIGDCDEVTVPVEDAIS